ncbi:MAG: DUF4168 domain-containing protein [Bacteroidota bacterium]
MKFKNVLSLLVVSFLFINAAVSQVPQTQQGQQQQKVDIEVSDEELKTFIEVSGELQNMQMEMRQKMGQIVKDNGMEMKRYQEIARGEQQGQDVETSEEEEKAYSAIQNEMEQENKKLEKNMEKVLDDYDMERQRFMDISKALRQDEELQNRFQELQQQQQQPQNPQE